MTKSWCIADDIYGKIVSKNPETQPPEAFLTEALENSGI